MTRPDPYDRFHEDLATAEGMREPPRRDATPAADESGAGEDDGAPDPA